MTNDELPESTFMACWVVRVPFQLASMLSKDVCFSITPVPSTSAAGPDTEAAKDFQIEFFSMILIHGLSSGTHKMDEALVDQLERLFTMGLNQWKFDVMIGHLVLTLQSFGFTRLMIREIVRTFMPLCKVFAAGAVQASSRQATARILMIH